MKPEVKIVDLQPSVERLFEFLSRLIKEVLPKAVDQEIARMKTVLTMVKGYEHQKLLPKGTSIKLQTEILALAPPDSPLRALLDEGSTQAAPKPISSNPEAQE